MAIPGGASNDLVAVWLQAGTAMAAAVASGVAYLIRRAVRLERQLTRKHARLERRLAAVEAVAADALAEVGWLRDELRDRRYSRRWYEAHPGEDPPRLRR